MKVSGEKVASELTSDGSRGQRSRRHDALLLAPMPPTAPSVLKVRPHQCNSGAAKHRHRAQHHADPTSPPRHLRWATAQGAPYQDAVAADASVVA